MNGDEELGKFISLILRHKPDVSKRHLKDASF